MLAIIRGFHESCVQTLAHVYRILNFQRFQQYIVVSEIYIYAERVGKKNTNTVEHRADSTMQKAKNVFIYLHGYNSRYVSEYDEEAMKPNTISYMRIIESRILSRMPDSFENRAPTRYWQDFNTLTTHSECRLQPTMG